MEEDEQLKGAAGTLMRREPALKFYRRSWRDLRLQSCITMFLALTTVATVNQPSSNHDWNDHKLKTWDYAQQRPSTMYQYSLLTVTLISCLPPVHCRFNFTGTCSKHFASLQVGTEIYSIASGSL